MLEIKNSITGEVLQVAEKDLEKDKENEMDWTSAKNGCIDLGSEWRLPTLEELKIIYEELHLKGKGKFKKDGYWSSKEYGDQISKMHEDSSWGFNFKRGGAYCSFKSNCWTYVRAVRDIKLPSSDSGIKSVPKNESVSSKENVSDLDIYIRYSDGDEEVGYFSINIESELKLPHEISYESLTHLISYTGLFKDENFLNAVKQEVSEFSLIMSDCPQIFITKINDIDLKSMYDYHFNNEENKDVVAALLNINSDNVSNFLSDYFHETTYSIENLF